MLTVTRCRKPRLERHARQPAPRRRPRLRAWTAAAVLLALVTSGCAAYRFGAASLYPSDIQTVYVPMFESNSFRRNLSELVTEAVCKEIEKVTPYKVVGTPDADSVLTAKLTSDTKRVLIEDAFDQPRETEVNMAIEVRWINRRGDLISQGTAAAAPQDIVTLSAPGTLVPEFGQSVSTAQLQAIQRIAAKVVSMMENPW
jgi:hypothetical protein